MLKWQYERGNFSFPSQWQSVLIGTQQQLSQSLELTPLSRCYAPLLPGLDLLSHTTSTHTPLPGPSLWTPALGTSAGGNGDSSIHGTVLLSDRNLSQIHQCFDWVVRGKRKACTFNTSSAHSRHPWIWSQPLEQAPTLPPAGHEISSTIMLCSRDIIRHHDLTVHFPNSCAFLV